MTITRKTAATLLALLISGILLSKDAKASPAQYADSMFHPSNFAIQGESLKNVLKNYMSDTVIRSTVMPVPMIQKWDYFEHYANDKMPPTYYLNPKADLYYYSLVDALTANEFQKLSRAEQRRFDPMIVGFDPMDLYATQHIKRMLLTYPGVFEGIGEFILHKEVLSDKVAGTLIEDSSKKELPTDAQNSKITLYNPSLVKILDLVSETGMVASLHNDIYETKVDRDGQIKNAPPDHVYTEGLKALGKSSPNAKVIWAHTGLGRFVPPCSNHLVLVADVLDSCPNWSVDISWVVVQRYIMSPDKNQPSFDSWVKFINKYQDRVVFGSDNVVFTATNMDAKGNVQPGRTQTLAEYRQVEEAYHPLWLALGDEVSSKVRLKNYLRLFDSARSNVRAWEAAHKTCNVWNLTDSDKSKSNAL